MNNTKVLLASLTKNILLKQQPLLATTHPTSRVLLKTSPNPPSWSRLSMGGFTSKSPSQEESFITETVNENCVVIFSKTTCSYCRMAKKVFEDVGTPYTAVELNKREDGQQLQNTLYQFTGATTVPRVFINGQCVGGGTEVKQLHKDGKLLPLLAECSNNTNASKL